MVAEKKEMMKKKKKINAAQDVSEAERTFKHASLGEKKSKEIGEREREREKSKKHTCLKSKKMTPKTP